MKADEAPVIRLMTSGELEILARKLPKEELLAHFTEDAGMVETVVGKLFPAGSECAPELADQFGGAFRNIFFTGQWFTAMKVAGRQIPELYVC